MKEKLHIFFEMKIDGQWVSADDFTNITMCDDYDDAMYLLKPVFKTVDPQKIDWLINGYTGCWYGSQLPAKMSPTTKREIEKLKKRHLVDGINYITVQQIIDLYDSGENREWASMLIHTMRAQVRKMFKTSIFDNPNDFRIICVLFCDKGEFDTAVSMLKSSGMSWTVMDECFALSSRILDEVPFEPMPLELRKE